MEISKHIKIRQFAKLLSKKLLENAEYNESEIAKDLQNATEKVGVRLTGLENKFKTETSLMRKIINSATKDISNSSFEEKLKKHSKRINDVLRYTFIFPVDSYEKSFGQILRSLRKSNYEIPERRIWNAWTNAGTQRDTGYRGINITIKSSNNQVFELQFHTEQSYILKNITHNLYEEARQIATSEKRRNEIIKQVIELAGEIEIPKEYKK